MLSTLTRARRGCYIVGTNNVRLHMFESGDTVEQGLGGGVMLTYVEMGEEEAIGVGKTSRF